MLKIRNFYKINIFHKPWNMKELILTFIKKQYITNV